MAYADINATIARGLWVSPDGDEPQLLPDVWRDTETDTIREDIPDLTDAELAALGWTGPVTMPTMKQLYNAKYDWDKSLRDFIQTEYSTEEKHSNVDYKEFWTSLIGSEVYLNIKKQSYVSLTVNTLLTEFSLLILDAKMGEQRPLKIQQSISLIIGNMNLSAEEIAELQEIFDNTGMSAVYTLS